MSEINLTRSNTLCPECGKGTLATYLVDEVFEFNLGDESVKAHASAVPVRKCDNCDFQMSGPEAARIRHVAVCKAAGFFTPEEIRLLRTNLGLSQEELAKLAGVGVATVSRWERGKVLQNRNNNNLLVLIAKSAEARRILSEQLQRRTGDQEDSTTSPPPRERFVCLTTSAVLVERQASYLRRETTLGVLT